MSKNTFKATLQKAGPWIIVVLPNGVSAALSSRGMVNSVLTVNGSRFQTVLEPDGNGSHWFKLDKLLHKATGADVGDTVLFAIEPAQKWPEPQIPADLHKALEADSQAHTLWLDITPMARWDWIRWINATGQQETRKRRITNAFSMLKQGKRRPCCFNRTLCTEASVSKNGVLVVAAP